MFRNFFKPFGSILFIMLAIFLVSCGGGGGGGGSSGGNPNPPPPPTILTVDISPNNGPVIGLPGQQQFTATVNYTNGTHKDVTNSATWKSSNPSVATIGSDGKATAVALGTTIIQVTFESVASEQVTLTVGNILLSASTKLPYSMPISESRTATFLVQNLSDTDYQLGPPGFSVNGYGSAVINLGSTTCGTQLSSHESCIYALTYTSPSDITKSGTLSDIKLQVNVTSLGIIEASTTTFIANGAANLQNGSTPIAIPAKVIILYNDDPTHTIYPVIETSRKIVDQNVDNPDTWIMSFLNETSTNIYTKGVYRIYVGGESGILPEHYAMISVPFYSEFSSTPPNGDKYIDWWRGTRIYVYDNPVATQFRMGRVDTIVQNSKLIDPVKNSKICFGSVYNQVSCHDTPSVVYQDKGNTSFPNSDPMQLMEYTLGSDGGEGNFKWNGTAVDYDISFVDNLYLVAAVGKVDYSDNTLGWIGSDARISYLQQLAQSRPFMGLTPPQGLWPMYIYSTEVTKILESSPAAGQVKIPSSIDAMANPYAGFPAGETPSNGLPFAFNRLQANNQWMITSNTSPLQFQQKIISSWSTAITNNADAQLIWSAFESNYAVNCPSPQRQPLTLDFAVPYMVGFVQFSQCVGGESIINKTPLPNSKTPEGKALLNAYHHLMNETPGQTVNPWVDFVHNQLGLAYVYSYSIDDAVGNVETTGDGMIINVSGTTGVTNKQAMLPADKTMVLSFGGLPLNAYVYASATVCGLPVLGETQVDQESSTNPIRPAYHGIGIVGNNYPIYLPAASNGKSCNITITGKTLLPLADHGGHSYNPGTPVHASFTVSNAVYPRSPAGAAALTNSMKASCTDNIGNLFCQGLNASSTSDSLLYTIAFPG